MEQFIKVYLIMVKLHMIIQDKKEEENKNK